MWWIVLAYVLVGLIVSVAFVGWESNRDEIEMKTKDPVDMVTRRHTGGEYLVFFILGWFLWPLVIVGWILQMK